MSLIAAATGVAVVSYLFWLRARTDQQGVPPLRNVTDVLSECYVKMRELQAHLADLPPISLQTE
jgi:hypothetical protein